MHDHSKRMSEKSDKSGWAGPNWTAPNWTGKAALAGAAIGSAAIAAALLYASRRKGKVAAATSVPSPSVPPATPETD